MNEQLYRQACMEGFASDLLFMAKLLPVLVKQEIRNAFEATPREAEEAVAEALEGYRRYMVCERIGHIMGGGWADITPEHGTEWLECANCGYVETIHWY